MPLSELPHQQNFDRATISISCNEELPFFTIIAWIMLNREWMLYPIYGGGGTAGRSLCRNYPALPYFLAEHSNRHGGCIRTHTHTDAGTRAHTHTHTHTFNVDCCSPCSSPPPHTRTCTHTYILSILCLTWSTAGRTSVTLRNLTEMRELDSAHLHNGMV